MKSVLLVLCLLLAACATQRQTDAAVGAGVGAALGKLIGGNTSDAALGAAIGGGIGWAVNRQDKPEVGPLGGTTWLVVSAEGQEVPVFESLVVAFSPDGVVTTTRTEAGGTTVTNDEQYRVLDETLVILRKDGVTVNASFLIEGSQLILEAMPRFRGVLRKV